MAADLIVERCGGCGGYWLDRGEIYRFMTRPAELQKELAKAYPSVSKTVLTCGRCAKAMARARISEAGLEFEVCAACGGTWFDQGEIEALRGFLERAGAAPVVPATPRPSGQTALLLAVVLAVCGAAATGVGLLIYHAFPQLF